MSLAEHVRTLGRGPGRARSLNRDEARHAMDLMLRETAAPEAVGAILMLLRMKGETADEIAGFAQAAQQGLPELGQPDLDWPCYAAGRTRGLPWFLLSAKLIAAQGHGVLLHGWNGSDRAVRDGLSRCAIPVTDVACASGVLAEAGIAYLPLETLSPRLFHLLTRRDVLGLRSCVNTVCRMLNPGQAKASVQGVFHPSYRLLQTDAAALLGLDEMTVIKGGGGEFERHPSKAIAGFGRRAGAFWEDEFPALHADTRRLAQDDHPAEALAALWSGDLRDAFAEAVVIGTAELALATLGHKDADTRARALWDARVIQ